MASTPDDKSARPPAHAEGSLRQLFHSWRYFFYLLSLLAVVALFYAEENWRAASALAKYRRELQARGAVVAPSTLIPPPVPDEQNFAATPFLAPLFEFVSSLQRQIAPQTFDSILHFPPQYDAAASLVDTKAGPRSNSWLVARIDLPAWHAAFLVPTNHAGHPRGAPLATNVPLAEAAAGVLAALAEGDPVWEELRAAARRPFSRFNIHYDQDDPASILLPHLGAVKHLCQVLQLHACAELALHRTAEAAQDLDLMFTLVEATHTEPILISQLVRVGELPLLLQPLAEGLGQWSDGDLRHFQERLQRIDLLADVKRCLVAERVLFSDGLIKYIRRAPNKMRVLSQWNGNSGAEWAGLLIAAGPSGWLDFEQLNCDRLSEDYLAPAIDLPNRQIAPSASRRAEERFGRLATASAHTRFFHHEYFAALMLPSIMRAVQKTAFGQTAADLSAVACTLERYRLANGQFPETLEALVPRFIEHLPHDVITRQPLKYRPAQDFHYLLYSVGWNETDEHGTVLHTKNADGNDLAQGDWVWAR